MSDAPAPDDSSPVLIDGYPLDRLSDYLDAGMSPPDPGIDSSPACLLALDALRAVETAVATALDREAAALPPPSPEWVARVLDTIGRNVLPGRSIPLAYPDPGLTLTTTESALRGLVRAVGDDTPGVLVGRCVLDGDVTTPGASVRIDLEAAVLWGRSIPATVARLRADIVRVLREQAFLNVTAVDVTVHDIQPPAQEASS